MHRSTWSPTRGEIGLEAKTELPVSSGENHGASHIGCLWVGAPSKGRTGLPGVYGSSPFASRSSLTIQLLVVVLLLGISFCMQRPRGSVRRGMQRRRLGNDGEESEEAGDAAGPPSPDFSELCLELGAWSPSETLPGQPRSSPSFVEAYLMTLEQSTEQRVPQASPPSAAPIFEKLLLPRPRAGGKRPLDQASSDEEDAPGPSWKVASTRAPAGAAQTPSQFGHPGTSGPKAPSQPCPGLPTPAQTSEPLSFHPPTNNTVSQPLHTAPAHQLAASTSASSDAATSSSAGPVAGLPQPHPLEGSGSPQHPFVRFPTLQPGVTPRPFTPEAMGSANLPSRRHCHILLKMREMLRKFQLSQIGAHNLVYYSEDLASHAYLYMQDEIEGLSPYVASARLGRKFLAFYYLLRASQVLKQNWPSQSWWGKLVERIPHTYFYNWERDPRASAFYARLANDLSAATAQLKSGVFPPSCVIIGLKRRLFCMPESPSIFKEKLWNPWREDDEESRKEQRTSRNL